jgi:regulator of PEP synthase PpsR (kinase-PPPase family)
MVKRSVFIISDGTGITAEILGHSLLSQFPSVKFSTKALPFINNDDKLLEALKKIDAAAREDGAQPLIFATFVDRSYIERLRASDGLLFDLFGNFLRVVSGALGVEPTGHVGDGHGVVDPDRYTSRIRAVHFSMDCDDGLNIEDYNYADLIIVGVSRIGKTPVSLYLAMHFGIFCANYPLVDGELSSEQLPPILRKYQRRLFGLTTDYNQLQKIRNERRPRSQYSDLQQCREEVQRSESLFRQHNVAFLNTNGISIEEIATAILQRTGLRRQLLG